MFSHLGFQLSLYSGPRSFTILPRICELCRYPQTPRSAIANSGKRVCDLRRVNEGMRHAPQICIAVTFRFIKNNNNKLKIYWPALRGVGNIDSTLDY